MEMIFSGKYSSLQIINSSIHCLEVQLVGLVVEELSGPADHALDGARAEGVVAPHDELVTVRRHELQVRRVRPHAEGAHRISAHPVLDNFFPLWKWKACR